MAHIQPTKRKDGRSAYRARWIDPSGKEKCKTFDLKREAQRHLDEVAADLLTGRYADPRSGKVTVRVYGQRWVSAQPWEDNTRANQRGHLTRHVHPYFGDRPLGSLRPTEIQGWATTIGNRFQAMTARSIIFTFTSMIAAAVRDRIIGVNPCEDLTVPEREMTPVVIPTPEQVALLHAAAPARFTAAVLVAAGLGLRQSEMTGLTADRITFPLGTPLLGVHRGHDAHVQVDQQLSCVNGKAPFLKKPKSRNGIRQIPMAAPVASALTGHLAEHPATHPWGLVFTTEDGGPITRVEWSRIWGLIRADAGQPDVKYHHLRHYYASSLIRFGATVKEVQVNLGHGSSRTTLDIYGHLWPDSGDRSRDAVTAALDFSKSGGDAQGDDGTGGGVLARV